MNLPNHIVGLINELESAGQVAGVLGECVRETVEGESSAVFDVYTTASPEQAKQILKTPMPVEHMGATPSVKVGRLLPSDDHAHRENKELVFTTVRSLPCPGCSILERVEAELTTRCFSAHAIAYHPRKGFLDPHFGLTDIRKKTVRCIGSIDRAFLAKPERMLTALILMCCDGYMIDEDVEWAIHKHAHRLRAIDKAVKRDALDKLKTGPDLINILVEYSDVAAMIM